MATVAFTYGAFLHDAENPDDYVTITDRRAPSYERAPIGDVSVTASGRRVWTSNPGVTESFSVSYRTLDQALRLWIERRDGQLVLYRDIRGRFEYAVIRSVSVTDVEGVLYDISFTLTPVDRTEDIVT